MMLFFAKSFSMILAPHKELEQQSTLRHHVHFINFLSTKAVIISDANRL